MKIKVNKSKVDNVNWNDMDVNSLKDVNILIINIGKLERESDIDLQKLEELKKIDSLKKIIIISKDARNVQYMSELLKSLDIEKIAKLKDDFENKDRQNCNLQNLYYNEILVPSEYATWGIDIPDNASFYVDAPITPQLSKDEIKDENLEIIDKQIDEWLKIPDLTVTDKVVLVANFIQSNFQYVQGKTSYAKGKKYVVEEFDENIFGEIKDEVAYFGNIKTLLNHNMGHCAAISKLTTLMLNNPKMNVNCRIIGAPGHLYNVIYDDDKCYAVDMTWGITRNPNRIPENLKAKSFCDDFLMIGQDEIDKLNQPIDHHTPINELKQPFEKDILDRNEIKNSMEKLKQYGIKFEYFSPVFISQKEDVEEIEFS